MPSRDRGTYCMSRLAESVVLVCILTITRTDKCGHSAAAPIRFVNEIVQKRKEVKAIDMEETHFKEATVLSASMVLCAHASGIARILGKGMLDYAHTQNF